MQHHNSSLLDLEMKKYDRETTPAHINTMVQVLKDVGKLIVLISILF